MAAKNIFNIHNNDIGQINLYQTWTHIFPPDQEEIPKNIWFDVQPNISTFTGRSNELQEINLLLTENKACVICGLAGVGKTELARKYAWQFREYYNSNVIWIHAETQDTLKESFDQLAAEMHVPIRWEGLERKYSSVIRQIYTYFIGKKCLVVFDNASKRRDIEKYRPSKTEPNLNIHILVTSQNNEWGSLTNLPLSILPKKDAFLLMVNCLKDFMDIDREQSYIEKLVDLMENLPLALQQAAAYIVDRNKNIPRRFTVQDYIIKFKLQESLLEHKFDGYAFPDYSEQDYNKTVFINFLITLEKIKETNSALTIDILYLLPYCVPDIIPVYLFKPLLNEYDDLDILDDSVRIIKKYSLVSLNGDTITVHRLIQCVIRLHVKQEGLETEILMKALRIICLNENKHSIHAKHIINWARNKNIIDYYYSKCENKELFLYTLAFCRFDDILIDIIKKIESVEFFKGDDIITAAVKTNNIQLIKLLIEKGAEINTPDKYGKTALCVAASEGSLDMVQFLVANGADVNKTDHLGKTPLNRAAKCGNTEILKYLNHAGGQLHKPDQGLLHDAAQCGNIKVIEFLLENGADINERLHPSFKNYRTALDFAAGRGDLETVKYLVEKGARDINISTYSEIKDMGHGDILKYLIETGIYKPTNADWKEFLQCVLMGKRNTFLNFFIELCPNNVEYLLAAARNGQIATISCLIENGVSINCEDDNGNTLLHIAAENNHIHIIKYLLKNNININYMNKNGQTALYLAAKSGHTDIVINLCENGADLSIYTTIDASPIYASVVNCHTQIVTYLTPSLLQLAMHFGLLNLVTLLMESIVHVDSDFATLHKATFDNHVDTLKLMISNINEQELVICDNQHVDAIKFLITNGANVNFRKNNGQSALDLSCRIGHLELVEYLIENGANINGDGVHISSLVYATEADKFDVVKYLVCKGANVNDRNLNNVPISCLVAKNGQLELLQFFVSNGLDLFDKSTNGKTMLHFASEAERFDVIEYLLRNKVNINEKDNRGMTVLMEATIEDRYETVKFLIKNGANVNDKNFHDVSVLYLAASCGNLNVLKLLIENQANIFQKNFNNTTALHAASLYGYVHVVDYLCSKINDVNSLDREGYTPLHCAVRKQHLPVIKVLVNHGADIHIKHGYAPSPFDLAISANYTDILKFFTQLNI